MKTTTLLHAVLALLVLSMPTMNLDVLDGLLGCLDKPYSETYGAACRPGS